MINKIKVEDIQTIIEDAGRLLSEVYKKQDFTIELKEDNTPVTEADKLSSDLIIRELNRLYPDIPILCEETQLPEYKDREKWEYLWIVDPLDGTKEFIYKNGRFCINIALVKKGTPVFGMINNISDGEIMWAIQGEGCFIKREDVVMELPYTCRDDNKLKVAVSRFNITEEEFRYIDFLMKKGFDVELLPLGASSKHCMLAKGEVDICAKFGRCSEWDVAAGAAIVQESGGYVVNAITKKELIFNKESIINPPFLMFNKKIHEKIKEGDDIYLKFKSSVK